jgi:hypothetical protein
MGVHDSSCPIVDEHSPMLPWLGFVIAQLAGTHSGCTSVPLSHESWPERVYPSTHLGVHDAPCGSVSPQSPLVAFSGMTRRVHALGLHAGLDNRPYLHTAASLGT